MTRPRWHDVLIIAAIAGVLVVGVWALWWDDVRSALNLGPAKQESEQAPITGPSGQT
ncbi:MAG: hypothetical protein SFX73_24295 [Kofleriaceae bacterium]|nr:hypothetical protein [Kofleriaceae bacterium]